MQFFQKTVLLIAIVLLFVTYTVVYFTTTNKKTVWNNVVSKCPDYWIYNSNTNQCEGSNSQIYDLNNQSACDKYNWAINENSNMPISWDGITYGSSLKCDATTI